MKENQSDTNDDELPPPEPTSTGDQTDVVATQLAVGSPTVEEPNASLQETATPTHESMEDSKHDDGATAKKSSTAIHDESTVVVQELPIKEEMLSDVQEESKQSVTGLPSPADDNGNNIIELPVLQEEPSVPQVLQEFTEIITSKLSTVVDTSQSMLT